MAKREFLMLAHPRKGNEPIGSWMWSEKLDGCRAFWDGGITRGLLTTDVPFANTEKDGRYVTAPKATGLWSRYGKPIQAPDWWLDKMPNFFLDGELYIGRNSFQELISTVKKLTPDSGWSNVYYMAFDSPPSHVIFSNGEIDNTNFRKSFVNVLSKLGWLPTIKPARWEFKYVYEWLRERGERNEVFNVHKQHTLHHRGAEAEEELSRQLDLITQSGAEGIMVRNPMSLWAPQRSRTLLKIKTLLDAEAVVTGYTWGRETDKGSKLLGKMGALICKFKGHTFELSGFTDDERVMSVVGINPADNAFEYGCSHPGEIIPETFYNPKFPRGSIITFKYRELTDSGIPKEARYWRKYES